VAVYLVVTLDGLAYGLLLFTVAAGLTVAFGVGNVLNLAHGTFYAVGAYLATAVADGTWQRFALGVLLASGAGVLAGGGLAAALGPLDGRGHLPQALLTFGVALSGGALLVAVSGAGEQRPVLPAVLDTSVTVLGHRYPAYRLGFIVVAAVLAAAGWAVVRRTAVGARMRAMADDRDMLAGVGTNPRTVLALTLAAAGGLAGLAGALGAPMIGPGPHTAELVLLLSLVIVVLGGLGSVGGALVAAVAVGQIQSLGVVLFPALSPYLLFTAIAAVLVIRRDRTGAVVARP
jgi:branched-subunit amino acid ABC-type transport system permease component